jgi:hypothetical protein
MRSRSHWCRPTEGGCGSSHGRGLPSQRCTDVIRGCAHLALCPAETLAGAVARRGFRCCDCRSRSGSR